MANHWFSFLVDFNWQLTMFHGFSQPQGTKCDFTCHCHGGHGGINTGWDCQPVISLILYQDCSRPVLAAKIVSSKTVILT